MRAVGVAGLVCALGVSAPAQAAFHLMKVVEVFPGTVGSPNAQYVELQMYSGSQNLVSGHRVIVYDAAGAELGRATFSSNVSTSTNQSTILIATAEAAALFSMSADLTIGAHIVAAGGKVCFDEPSASAGTIDCVAWGSYAGAAGSGGAAVGTPYASPTPGLTLGRAIHRRLDISGGSSTLENADDTGSSANDFVDGAPTPRNNAGATGSLPTGTCGNSTIEGAEGCDDGDQVDTGNGCSASCARNDVCRNGITESLFEECDDDNAVNTDDCLNTCEDPTCGDGFAWSGHEPCDDGNNGVQTDACLDGCVAASCGDGFVEAGVEECDLGTGTNANTGLCKLDCTDQECGDSFVGPGEACDDGNDDDTDDCANDCTLNSCGDGNVDIGEDCDDENADNTDACVDCQDAECGDGFVRAGVEACDDGDADDTDGCLTTCEEASCGDGFVEVGVEDCDDTNEVDTDACVDCVDAACGDGFVQAGVEACDDGNDDDGDGCSAACAEEFCGDTVLQDGEECDDGNADADDGCSDTCAIERCGDGVQQASEGCDDGNTFGRDGCSAICTVESGDTGDTGDDDGCGGCDGTPGGPAWLALALLPALRRRSR